MYEYKCQECGSVVEHLVGVGRDQPEIACDSCGSSSLEKLMSLVSISTGLSRLEQAAGCCGRRDDCNGDCSCEGAFGLN